MDRKALEARTRDVEAQSGTWSAHSFQLDGDLYTIAADAGWDQAARLRRVVQVVAGAARTPVDRLRILDLGALEGLFCVEFARRGAEVVAGVWLLGVPDVFRLLEQIRGVCSDLLVVEADVARAPAATLSKGPPVRRGGVAQGPAGRRPPQRGDAVDVHRQPHQRPPLGTVARERVRRRPGSTSSCTARSPRCPRPGPGR